MSGGTYVMVALISWSHFCHIFIIGGENVSFLDIVDLIEGGTNVR